MINGTRCRGFAALIMILIAGNDILAIAKSTAVRHLMLKNSRSVPLVVGLANT